MRPLTQQQGRDKATGAHTLLLLLLLLASAFVLLLVKMICIEWFSTLWSPAGSLTRVLNEFCKAI